MSIKNPYSGLSKAIGKTAIAIETGMRLGFDEGVEAANEDWIKWFSEVAIKNFIAGEGIRYYIPDYVWQGRKKEINQ